MPMILLVLFVLLGVSPVWAEDKPKVSCEVQLAESMMHARNVSADLNTKGHVLAKEQVRIYLLEQQVAALKKQVEELSKPKETPAP